MVDYFGNRHWAARYWASRYYQGGVLPEGSVEASLSGTATVTATLSRVRLPVTEVKVFGGRRKWRPKLPPPLPPTIPAMATAHIACTSTLSATGNLAAVARAGISGTSSLMATGELIDIYALEAEFWLIAA